MTRARDAKLTPIDGETFRSAIETFGAFPQQALADGIALLRARELDAGQHLLMAGRDPARDVVFVVHGLLREYFLGPSGEERTKAFIAEGGISGSLADLLSEQPSYANIVAEEDTRVLLGEYKAMKRLGERYPCWEKFGREMTARLLRTKARREYELLALDAAARYAEFRALYPQLEARIKAKHVASYVGITPVHLSRLRRARRGAPSSTR